MEKFQEVLNDEPIEKINQFVWKYATETVGKELRTNENISLYFINALGDKAKYVTYIKDNKYSVTDNVEVNEPGCSKEIKKFIVELEVLGKLREWKYNVLTINIENV